ncbi:MAG: YARHG domain-containing protein [Spirochaetes bacterium]|nr:YARHG domain-containing protein [Spirochaetota bacterium]MBU0954185.1 YARHG domain-containing protein [Spirochaetota bacterium]
MKRILALLILTATLTSAPKTVQALDAQLTNHIEAAISSHFIGLSYIPNAFNRIEAQSFRIDTEIDTFIFRLRIAKQTDAYTESDSTPIVLYDDYTFMGTILSLAFSDGRLAFSVVGSSNYRTETLIQFYGYRKESSDYTMTFREAIVYDINAPKQADNQALYFLGTVRPFTEQDLRGLSLDELAYLRNEFFARKGYIFQTEKMRTYFAARPWYKPTTANVSLPSVEAVNVEYIRSLEKRMAFGSNSSDIEKINNLYAVAQRRQLTESDLRNLSPFELPYLRNTFYAKKGLIFYLLQYRDYFERQSWYKGTANNVDDQLSPLDKANIRFIQSLEN